MKNVKKFFMIFVFIVLFLAAIFLVESLIEEYYIHKMGNQIPFVASSNTSSIPMLLGMLLLGILVWLHSPYGLFGNEKEIGIKAPFSKKMKWIITGMSAMVGIVITVLSIQWTTFFTTEGIVDVDFGKRTVYSWDEVETFEVDFDGQGILMFVMHMNNGDTYFFNGGFWRWCEYMNDAYEEQFEDGCYDYMPWLAVELKSHGATMNVENWKELLRKSHYDSWTECAEDIRAAYDNAM